MTSKSRRFCPLTLYRDGTDLHKIIAVYDIPDDVDGDDLAEYIEDVCSCTVDDVYFSCDVNEVALVKLLEPIEDMSRCKRNISRRKLNREMISLQLVSPPNGIVVTNLPSELTEDMLDDYFRSRDSGNTSKSPASITVNSQTAIVTFKYPSKVLENILSRRHSPFGIDIYVEPYYPPFHDQVMRYLKRGTIHDDCGSSSEESIEEYLQCGINEYNESSDQLPTAKSSRRKIKNHGSKTSRSSSSECSDSSQQPERFGIALDSDESSDSSLEAGKRHKERKRRQKSYDLKLTRDYDSVPLDLDKICENEEDKLLLAKIFKNPIGEKFKDSTEMKYDCTIDIEFITKDEVIGRNKNGAAGRQKKTESKKVQQPKAGLVASLPNGFRQANHLFIKSDSLCAERMLILNDLNYLSGNRCRVAMSCPVSFSEPRKTSMGTQAYRKKNFQFDHSTVTIKQGNITKENADVIVNVVGPDLEYNGNRISSSIVEAGGRGLAKMLKQHTGDTVMKTGSGNLPCGKVYTLTLDIYRGNKSEKIYKETIRECLDEGLSDNIKSISFPIIGYGKAFKYPKSFVLETLVSQIILTIGNPANTFLKNFTIVSFDEDIFDDLDTLLQRESRTKQKGAAVADSILSGASGPTTETKTKLVGCKILINGRKRNIDRLSGIIENSIKEHLLYRKTINKPSSSCMSLRARGHAFGYAAKTKCVLVTDIDNTTISLKGHKDTVEKSTKDIISIMETQDPSILCKAFKCPPKFWRIIANQDPQSPPYWRNLEPNTELRTLFHNNPPKKRFYRVDVDKTTEQAVKLLVKKTWREDYVGMGKDAVNLTHTKIRIKKVERIENLELFNKYAQKRLEYFRMLADEQQQKLLSLGELKVQTQGSILTQKHLPEILQQDIFPEINEHFLFHGTKPDLIQTTVRSGLDSRLSNANALFGTGIYTAESSTKADQYTDSKTNRTSGDHQMLLVRMLLGKMYVCSDPNPPKYRRPPCMNMECRRDNCTGGHDLHDSVIADGKWLFREFIVYSPDQCYPEYLITYQRE